jgi:hypothetical protein
MPRTKGAISVRSKTFAEIVKGQKEHPLVRYLKLLNHPDITIELEEKILSTCFPYLFPKLTAIQLSGDPDSPLIIELIRFADIKNA